MISRAGMAALVLVAVVAGGGDLRAQPAAADAARLREQVERRFDVLPLREGLVLRATRHRPGVRAVQIAGGTIAIDGTPTTGAELRQKLGADADSRAADLVSRRRPARRTARHRTRTRRRSGAAGSGLTARSCHS